MNDNITENNSTEPDQKNLALLVYILQGLGFVTGGLTWVVAMMINYIKLDEVGGSWLESHFRWQLKTFWYGLFWWILGLFMWLLLLGWLVWGLLSLWALYRIVRGALALNDNKPINF